MKRIQTDVTPLPAKELVGLLAKAGGAGQDAATEMLLHWDLATTRELAAAAL
jgi:hypothetical protein